MAQLHLQRLALASFLATAFIALPATSSAQDKDARPTRRILAVGGGGYHGFNRILPKYFLSLTGKKNPVVYYLPTAVGDSDRWIVDWYDIMNELECRPRHLKLFDGSRNMKNLETTLLSADAIYVGGGNTMNMIAVWKAHGVDKILRKAYDKGIVLGGESAGMICWFEQAVTDSRPEKLSMLECLGFLKGSACPHYFYEQERQPAYHQMIRDGAIKDGIACADFTALYYENEALMNVWGVSGPGMAFNVRRGEKGRVHEQQLFGERLPVEKARVVNLWPGKPADDNADSIGEEKFFQLKIKGKPYEVAGRSTKWLTNVTTPTLTISRPDKRIDTGAAVIICPGGGYHNLGWDVEGTEVAGWLNSIGVTGIILKYRCPRRPGDVKGVPPIGPLKDAQRAVSLVRANANDWGINPDRIGMVGFSAGGHLVGATCTNFEKRAYTPSDNIDKVSCRPDFGIMCYSGYFKVGPILPSPPGRGVGGEGLSPTVKTPKKAPPMFFVHATDDAISDADHSVAFYLALKQAKIDATLHVYATGGHGFGVRPASPCFGWTRLCADWMRDHGWLKKQ